MKKTVLVIICLMLLVVGCGKEKEQAYIQPLENYDISVKESSEDSVTISFREIKQADNYYCMNDDYTLEKETKLGKWEEVKPVNDVDIEPVAHCAEEFEITHDIKARYGSLKKGSYRIVKVAFSETGANTVSERKEATIKLPFNVK